MQYRAMGHVIDPPCHIVVHAPNAGPCARFPEECEFPQPSSLAARGPAQPFLRSSRVPTHTVSFGQIRGIRSQPHSWKTLVIVKLPRPAASRFSRRIRRFDNPYPYRRVSRSGNGGQPRYGPPALPSMLKGVRQICCHTDWYGTGGQWRLVGPCPGLRSDLPALPRTEFCLPRQGMEACS